MPMRRAVRITRQAISPRLAIRILENICFTTEARSTRSEKAPQCLPFLRAFVVKTSRSHPEHAEAPAVTAICRDRRVQRGGDTQSQHQPRLGGVDNAVVP